MFSYYNTRQFALNILLIIIILFMKFNYYEFTTNGYQGYFTYGQTHNSNSSLLRFRDFEPRYAVKTDNMITELMTIPRRYTKAAGALTNRKSRGFQFHTDDKDVTVDMEFVVPFLRIPMESSMEMTKRSFRNMLNLNKNSLLTAGAVVGAGVLLAVILKVVFTLFASVDGYGKTSRNEEENITYPFDYANSTEQIKTNNIIGFVAAKLQEHNIDLSKCAQSYICEYVQRIRDNVRSGSSSSLQKILDGILSLRSVIETIQGTAIHEAIDVARSDNDCSQMYEKCAWNSRGQKVLKLISKIIRFLNFT